MTLRISAPLSAFAGAALLVATAIPAAADSSGAKLDYEVWAGGVRVLEATIVMRTGEGRYRMELEAEQVGPPSWVEDYKLTGYSEGVLGESGPEPEIFRLENRSGDEDHWVQITYADGMPTVEADTNLEKKRRTPVEDSQKQDTVDPLTGLLSLVQQVAAAGSCEGLVPVYDGRRRFDVMLTDKGHGELPNSRYNAYAGPTERCDVTLKPIAGYRKSGTEQFPAEVTLQGANIVDSMPALPVRLDTEIAYGALILHLIDYEPIDLATN